MQRLPTVAAILVPILLLQAAPGNAQYFDDDANLSEVQVSASVFSAWGHFQHK
jgi:hypothetical protein